MSESVLFQILVAGGFISAALVFVLLFFVVAPYGRHVRQGWGPTINNTAGWIIMETPAALTLPICFVFGTKPVTPALVCFLLLWELHYVHRTYIFPFRMRNRSKRMPVLIMMSAFTFNVFNGYLNGRYLTHFGSDYPAAWLGDPRFLGGLALFFAGFASNIHADQVLFQLRKPGDPTYYIPRGGLYRWISCPNYFGELLEWSGWALATWSGPGLLFTVWTAANLVPRARANHLWYQAHFPNYPAQRKAVIPFIF